jgi:hypothetical protein
MQNLIVIGTEELRALVRSELEALLPRLQAASGDTPKGKYFTKSEAARLCKTSLKTIEAKMRAGDFEYVKQGDGRQGRVLILAESVNRYLGNRTRLAARNLSRNRI